MLETEIIVVRGRDFISHRQKKALLASTVTKSESETPGRIHPEQLQIFADNRKLINCLFMEFI